MKPKQILRIIFLSLGLVCSCSKIEQNRPPNIVWIVSEDNSKHYLSLFDNNGIETPNIRGLAEHGILFNKAFSNAPVCSVARSTIISGCYAPRTGTQYHRRSIYVPMPDSLKMFPTYLRSHGYYTANNSKEDYNFIKEGAVWDESSKKATWENRGKNQPFFYVHNIGTTHESSLHFPVADMVEKPVQSDLKEFEVHPKHPDTDLFRYTNARYRDKILEMDVQLGEVVNKLKEKGELENTFIFYFGDHGGVLPGSKGFLYETGLHVPLVVRIPENYKDMVDLPNDSISNLFVNFVDLAPTVLNLAGVEIPNQIDGRPFLGEGVDSETLLKDSISYGYADRFDEKYDMVRSVRKGNFKYIRSFQPFNPDALVNNYRYRQAAYREWKNLYDKGELNSVQASFFKSRSPEMLFDLNKDPNEMIDLADDPVYQEKLEEMRKTLNSWICEMPDLSFYPEYYLIDNAFGNPVSFGRKHRKDIIKYLRIADIMLEASDIAQKKLKIELASSDPWQRYWALIVCSSFGKEVNQLTPIIQQIALEDTVNINSVRACEFLGITGASDPEATILNALYNAKHEMEALLILNSIVLLSSNDYGYKFNIEEDKINPKFKLKKSEVLRRIEFLKSESKSRK